jgi:hypothetical protein
MTSPHFFRAAQGIRIPRKILGTVMLCLLTSFLQGGEPSLVPDSPSTVPDYYCTWSAQGYLCAWSDPYLQADMMVEKQVFGEGANQGLAGLFPEIHQDIYLVLDDTWDIPLGKNRSYPGRGCFVLDTERFPSCTGTPAQRLEKLSRDIRARGWKGVGLWIYSGRPKAEDDPAITNEQFWSERLGWCRDAGIDYWKVDWGSMSSLEIWRLSQWAHRVAPALWMEHGALSRAGARIWQTDKLDIHRTYDVNDATAIPETIKRVAHVLRFPREAHSARGLINCEDELYLGAALGCTYGVMRYGLFRPENPDPYLKNHSPGFHDRRRCIDEVVRAVRWHRIAHPFATTEHELVDEATLPFEPFSKKGSAAAPARIARGGLPLPTVIAPDGNPLPFVFCSRFPEGEIAVATIGRCLGEPAPSGRFKGMRALTTPAAAVTLEAGELNRPIGVFGEYASLTFVTSSNLEGKRILAQDLAGKNPVDITGEVKVEKGKLTIPGSVIHRVGLMAGKPDDLSDPGLVLAIQGLTQFIPKPPMTPAQASALPNPGNDAGAGLKIIKAIWGPVDGGKDVTAQVAALVKEGTLTLDVNPQSLGNDSGTDGRHRLQMQYTCKGKAVEVLALSGERVSIDAQGVNRVESAKKVDKKSVGTAKQEQYREKSGKRSLALSKTDEQLRIILTEDGSDKPILNLTGPVSIITETEYSVTGLNEATGKEESVEMKTAGRGVLQMKRTSLPVPETLLFQKAP